MASDEIKPMRRTLWAVLKNEKPFLCVNDDIEHPMPEHHRLLQSFFQKLIGNRTEPSHNHPTAHNVVVTCVGSKQVMALPQKAFTVPSGLNPLLSSVTVERQSYLRTNPDNRSPEALTASIQNLDYVDVDNSISVSSPPPLIPDTITVAELNAERGQFWCEFATQIRNTPKLAKVDIWLLNEFDLGMARTQQQHTLRILAHALGMNYAWAAEFVELTNGNAQEQHRTEGFQNRHALHGNAILSRWPLQDAKVVRMPGMAPLYSANGFETAGGYEKRLGGRMTLFASSTVGNFNVLLGATHAQTSWGRRPGHVRQSIDGMAEYINSRNSTTDAVVVAGDTWPSTCSRLQLDGIATEPQPSSKLVDGKVVTHGRNGMDDYICARGARRVGPVRAIPGVGHSRGEKDEFVLADHVIVLADVQFG